MNLSWAYAVQALLENIRIDGRSPFDSRKVIIEVCSESLLLIRYGVSCFLQHGPLTGCTLHLQFGQNDDSATVSLGSTRVLTTISPVLEAPYPDR